MLIWERDSLLEFAARPVMLEDFVSRAMKAERVASVANVGTTARRAIDRLEPPQRSSIPSGGERPVVLGVDSKAKRRVAREGMP